MRRHASAWSVVVEDPFETESSVIAFGTRDSRDVVLKVVKQPGDEWCSGEILEAFDGHGVVRVINWTPGAVLTERLQPGNSLVDLSLDGRDEEATEILADVILRISTSEASAYAAGISSSASDLTKQGRTLQHCPTVHDWAKGFERYIATGDDQIPADLVVAAQSVYLSLCASQQQPRLLHGDLQHYNVLFDADHGWLAIDPKGVVGELEYEVGAVLRNPIERPELFLSRSTIERRLKQFVSKLNLDFERALAWGFAQAVLSAIWEIEDGFPVEAKNTSLRLAEVIRPMLTEDRRNS